MFCNVSELNELASKGEEWLANVNYNIIENKMLLQKQELKV